MDWPLIIFQALIGTLMVISLFALLVPVFPGLTVIWGLALFYGIVVGFQSLGWVAWLIFIFMTLLMLFGNIVDNLITGKQAYDSGASPWSIAVAIVAGVISSIIWTPVGGLLIAPLALFLIEFYRLRDWKKSLASTKAWLIGLGWAFILRFLVGVAMIGMWLIWAINTH
jgi:uncharacterized protein YqgC (DUF456 family)